MKRKRPMEAHNSDFIFYLLLCFLSVYIVLQIYIIVRMKMIVERLIEILYDLDLLINPAQSQRQSAANEVSRTCKHCKYRIPFYQNNPDYNGYFYYRCQLTNRYVQSEHVCEHFVIDPQLYNAK
ncbi:MAG: hypothetical protein ONB16_05985 [candidate division KSB1 bacterium]|nr:hypothetical protein [candidate division KSB1 bacterium]MDZ7317791.1 hypothetical protein [candidate division KSB1 bacterium]MDZ7341678.1 hypothetical protein [candidate division KSB1 bacterium]